MDKIIISNENSKYANYLILNKDGQEKYNKIVFSVIHELLTTKGTNCFDLSYGTNFIKNLGSLSNVHKIRYFFDLEIKSILYKYPVDRLKIKSISFSKSTQSVDLQIEADFKDVSFTKNITHKLPGNFTEKDILQNI